MSKSLDEKESEQLFAAEEQGFKFIKVILNKQRVNGVQRELHIHGVKNLRVYSKGKNGEGIEQFEFIRSSGIIKFKRDRKDRAYVGYLWDDDEKGYYSPIGYNRDFLATHYETGDFRIVDNKIRSDIEERLENIKKILEEKKLQKTEEVIKVDPKMDIEDLDSQIDFLKSKKDLLLKSQLIPKRQANRRQQKPITRQRVAERLAINVPENAIGNESIIKEPEEQLV